ncbi:MAG: LON peptidase substrate-binding domain-containing protein [Terriglobales bacterium]
MSSLLPLFPLDLVLLPGATLPLHIFEPRYREMIGECLAQKREFGVVRVEILADVKEQRVADVGCTAQIVSVPKTYDDGRLDILVRGMQRFEILRVDTTRAFLQADVLYLQDKSTSLPVDDMTKAITLHAEILTLAGGQPESSATIEEGSLSFHLASSLPLDLDFKQRIIQMSSERERIQALILFFESVLPNLRRATHVRKKAGGNGHVI